MFENIVVALFPTFTDCTTLINEISKVFDNIILDSEELISRTKKNLKKFTEKLIKRRSYLNDFMRTEETLRFVLDDWINKLCSNDIPIKLKLSRMLDEDLDVPKFRGNPKMDFGKGNTHTGFIEYMFSHSPEYIAQQLTCVDQYLYSFVSVDQLIGQKWNSKKEEVKKIAKGITNFIQRFNQLCNWAVSLILLSPSKEERNRRYNFFVKILEQSFKMNNFMLATWVNSAVNATVVYKILNRGFIDKDPQNEQIIESFNILFDNNSSLYRQKLSECKNMLQPTIPYIGTHLSDLTFAEDGAPDFIKSKNPNEPERVNLVKKYNLYKMIDNVLFFQNHKHTFEASKNFFNYFLQANGFEDKDQKEITNLVIEEKDLTSYLNTFLIFNCKIDNKSKLNAKKLKHYDENTDFTDVSVLDDHSDPNKEQNMKDLEFYDDTIAEINNELLEEFGMENYDDEVFENDDDIIQSKSKSSEGVSDIDLDYESDGFFFFFFSQFYFILFFLI